jgi:uncharacterized protein (DUF1499 family)
MLMEFCSRYINIFNHHVQINDNDPTAALTRKRVDAIKKTCKSSGLLKRRFVDDLELDFPLMSLPSLIVSDSAGDMTWKS